MKILSALLIIAGLAACSSTETTTVKSSEKEDFSELEAKFWANVDNSRSKFTEADIAFMTGMIGHHAQALIMSDLATENSENKQIHTLASRIANAQKDEIQSMQKWLRDRDLPVPEVHIDGLNLMIHGTDHNHHANHAKMPGMLTQEQLVELSKAKGAEFNQLFLTYMIEHHKGAVTMVGILFNTDGAAQDEEAFRLASDIQVDQITEIERMKLMLEQFNESNLH